MRYNFIEVGSKKEFIKEINILYRFFVVTILLIFSSAVFYIYKSHDYTEQIKEYSQKLNYQKKIIYHKDATIKDLKNDITFINKIKSHNDFFLYSINLFMNIFPEDIVLYELYIYNGSIIINGVTVNRDIYKYKLLPILKNFFDQTYTTFNTLPNGLVNFISVNTKTLKFVNKKEKASYVDN